VTRALVVDDTEDIRLLMKVLLARRGLEVGEATNGVEALDALDRGPVPDVVVLDLQMPEMDGWETLRRLRERSGAADVAVVVCSVKCGDPDVRRAWELGCDGYIKKPFSNERFAGEIVDVLARSPDERLALRARRVLGDVNGSGGVGVGSGVKPGPDVRSPG